MAKRAAPSGVDLQMGAKLRRLRQEKSLSREMIGKKLGVSDLQIAKYEAGINAMRPAVLFDLATVLGVPVAFFFDSWNPNQAVLHLGRQETVATNEPPEADD